MQQKNIGAYLESGSLSLFAQQIVEILQGAFAVAIHDTDGVLVWAGPNEGDAERCTNKPAEIKRGPGPGYCTKLKSRNLAYVFYLDGADSDDPLGTLSVLVESPRPVSLEYAHRELQPILACIERQVAINAELSSVRRISTEGRDGLELLVNLDELDASAGPTATLQTMLKLVASHFGCRVAAVSLPNLGIQQAHPANVLSESETGDRIAKMLDSLNMAASKYKKVLVSDDSVKVKDIKANGLDISNVVCSPIVNSHDDVMGIFVLMGSHVLPTESIRLVRAICAKINLLTAITVTTTLTDPVIKGQLTRHELLRHMNTVLTKLPDSPHAFLYMDIDKLHVVNDSFGHVAGDEVIRTAIKIANEIAGENDAVAHLSGDRIGFFLQECDEKKALEKAELILQSLERNAVTHDGLTIDISASIGVAIMSDVVKDGSAALSTAEVAARSAKERGGGRAVVFRDVDASVVQRRSDLDQVSNLQSAFIDNRFVLYAQAITSLKEEEDSRRYEILVRMLDENGQLLLPAKFMSAAERYQMMIALDRWVINQTLDELGNSDNMLEINLASFSINLSAQSLADDDFVEYLTQRIVESGVSPEALCFEITETALVRHLDRAQRFIRILGKLGCRIALDDFGTGHCSFAYLKDMPVQYIKIDGIFVRDILDNPLSEAIVASVTKIAKVMHAYTVAEHVENDRVLQHLKSHDIDFVQGFAIGRPRPLADVLAELGPAVLFDTTTNLVRPTL